jgi:hypothetical protein
VTISAPQYQLRTFKNTLVLMVLAFGYGITWWLLLPNWVSRVLILGGVVGGVGILIADQWWGYRWYQSEFDTSFLITRSSLFHLVYLPLGLFVITSTPSWLGRGLVLGLGLGLSYELFLLRNHLSQLRQRWWGKQPLPATHQWSDQVISRVVWGFLIFWLLLTVITMVAW